MARKPVAQSKKVPLKSRAKIAAAKKPIASPKPAMKVPLKSEGKSTVSNKPIALPKPAIPGGKQEALKLDRLIKKYDVAVDTLRGIVEEVGEFRYELLAAEAKRERRRRFATLAEGGALHDLQTLAAAMEKLPSDTLPPSLSGVRRYAHIAVSQLARTFEVQAIHQPGDVVTVQESQLTEYDWSADLPGPRTFPLSAKVVRCGWKCGSETLVKPRLTREAS